MDDLLTDALDKLLADHCTPAAVRAAERQRQAHALWAQLEESGFADALLPEAAGGAGLSLQQAGPLLELCGRYALPLPLAETMLARAALAQSGATPPAGAIALAEATPPGAAGVEASVNHGAVAQWVLLERNGQARLLPAESATSAPAIFPLDARLRWSEADWQNAPPAPGLGSARALLACAVAAQLAGALSAVLSRTLQYANERQQFGRPIGKFQAIQHQLAALAEHVFAARMAARIGCASDTWRPDTHRVAIAKARTSEAALEAAALAHSIHGAIGFTEEFDLQLYTRRLHHWRQTAGTESCWHDIAGRFLLEQPGSPVSTLDAIRSLTDTQT